MTVQIINSFINVTYIISNIFKVDHEQQSLRLYFCFIKYEAFNTQMNH